MIKSDHWIRKMCRERRMIEPFEESMVSNGKVSFGVSSYGYDIRVSDEYKIFTNVHTTVVDPKAFDPRSFVDYKGPTCIVPPNSFALARSVEYFRIPRDVLAICLGKCLTGDTRLLDPGTGRLVRLEDFVANRGTSLVNWNCERSKADEATHHWRRGHKPVHRLRTRTGREIEATANHPFKAFSGWRQLGELRPGDRIAVPRRLPYFGKGRLTMEEATLLGLMISDGQCRTPLSSPRYTSGDRVLHAALDEAARAQGYFTREVGHLGRNITNRPHRGGIPQRNRMTRWLESLGLAVTSRFKFVPDCVFEAPKAVLAQFLRCLFSGDGSSYRNGDAVFIEYGTISLRLARDVHHLLLRFGIISFLDEKVAAGGYRSYRITITSKDEILRFHREIGFVAGTRKSCALAEAVAYIRENPQRKSNYDTPPPEAWAILDQACRKQGRSISSKTARAQSVPRALVANLAERLSDPDLGELAESDILWDSVESIEYVGIKPVYDLTMHKDPNFIANDIIVHNSTFARCGIIVNVTPLEPEWEGHLTIEISNTTPLPAKIYSDEGIAQLLFLGGDAVCGTRYKDRKGKYQGQTGVVLPRISAR